MDQDFFVLTSEIPSQMFRNVAFRIVISGLLYSIPVQTNVLTIDYFDCFRDSDKIQERFAGAPVSLPPP